MPNQAVGKQRLTKRRGVLLILLAPIVFVLSALFLANTLMYPPGSLQYTIGQILCFIVSPSLFVLGVAGYLVARKRAKKIQLAAPPDIASAGQPREKPTKVRPPMPRWERSARRVYIPILLVVLLFTILNGPGIMGSVLGPFAGTIFGVPIVFCLYLRSSWRGWVGAAFLLLLSSIIFFGLLPANTELLAFGTPGIGVVDKYLDWMAGINGAYGGLLAWLAVRAGVALSASIFLVVAKLLQLQRLHRVTGSRVFKSGAVILILIPFLLMFAISSPSITATAYAPIMYPGGVSWGGGTSLVPAMWSPAGVSLTFRTFNATTGLWTYTISLSNPTHSNVTITHMWANREVVEPLGTKITVSGSGVSVTDAGIVFAPMANGTIRFSTTVGYNTITLGEVGDARYQFTWPSTGTGPTTEATTRTQTGTNQTSGRLGIEGNATLYVKVLTSQGNPVKNLEVDLAVVPGSPPKGGVAITNASGIATFHVQPASYVIYFNVGTFPQNLVIPNESVSVTVSDNVINQQTITLQTK